MRAHYTLLLLFLVQQTTHAQVLNGSFEDALGNFDMSHWQYTCSGSSPFFGPAAPGFGSVGVLVPHSSPLSCGNSKLYQTIPSVQDGEVYTLSGWCFNWLYSIADPYIGFLMGTTDGLGVFHYYTGPMMNTGVWTFLSVTDTFHVAVGDTAFVMCDPGVVSGGSGIVTYGCFDGISLIPVVSTSVTSNLASTPPFRYDLSSQALMVHLGDRQLLEIALFDVTGRRLPVRTSREGSTLTVDMARQVEGIYLLLVADADGKQVIRFARP